MTAKKLVFSIVLIFFISIGIVVEGKETHSFSDVNFENQYIIGDTVSLPDVELTIGDTNYETTSVAYLPSGEAYKADHIILDQFGEYKIEYRCMVGDQLYTDTHSFIVIDKLFGFLNEKSTTRYGIDQSAYKTEHYGLNVSLQRGDKLTYNGIIDLSELTADDPAVELFVTPVDGFGTKDVGKIVIEFIDIYNSSNSVKIIGNAVDDDGDPGQWWTTSTYMQAGAFDTTTGIEWGSGLVHSNNVWGFPARFSFYGMQSKRSVVGEEFLSVSFDLDKKQVFGPLGSKDNFIVDLDDPKYVTEAWDGFTTGEVNMTITAEEYSGATFDFVITKIGNNDISPIFNYDLRGPKINIDYMDLDEQNVPKAKVGFTYPVFHATAFDAVSGASHVQVRVFYNYYAAQRFELPIIDGKFSVKREGRFTIEYKSYDAFGNVTIELVHIDTTNVSSPIVLDVDGSQLPDSSAVGTRIDLPSIQYSGGFGELDLKVYAKLDDELKMIEDEYFRPEKDGNYQIIIEVTDTIGQKETFVHDLEIDMYDLPVFIEDAVLPKYIIADSSYELDQLRGYDYTIKDYVDTKIFVTDGNGSNQLVANHTFTFTPDINGKAKIMYKATNDTGTAEVSYVIDVIDVNNPHIDMSMYFVGVNLKKKALLNDISLGSEDTQTDSSFEFINTLNGNQFSVKFRIDPFKNNFNSFDLYLKDYNYNQEQIKVSFIKAPNGEQIIVKVNDQLYGFDLKTTFINGGEIEVLYDNFSQTLSINHSDEKIVKTYINGNSFKGFSSSSIYMSGALNQVTGASAILLTNINGQLFTSDQDDFVKPYVSINGTYKSTYLIDEQATIYSALAFDVLDPEVIGSVTVKDFNGNIVTSIDGVKLDAVSFNRSYDVVLDSYGSYLVTYIARDTNGSGKAEYSYALFVIDQEKPIIEVSGTNVESADLNKSFKIKSATATDSVDGDLRVTYFVVLPTGVIVHIENQDLQYIPTIKGTYKIRYYAIDLSGNQVFNDYEVLVD